ncbi:hypothetical protein NQ186_17330 [Pseudomonas zeae]|uniref:hypothetical protein n=1 Tax=Pseudomonas zeae TaxID=2745510 RepID=UPI0021476A2C|nr:hypothetical protein [Pseudomonas zeae]UUT10428.1 hypothetical protein NQ186_17330 [Pseudomonas zeae]
MEEFMAANIGDKLNLVGFFFTICGIFASLVGAILMFVGSGITGDSVWDSIRKARGEAEQASLVVPEQWTEFVEFDLSSRVPPGGIASEVMLAYKMHSPDTRIPLLMTVASSNTIGVLAHGSGGQGELNLAIDNPLVYVSVAHPSIKWDLVVSGYRFNR